MKKIVCKNVSKSYKKNTLLSLIAAHNPVTSGDITLDDEIISENQVAHVKGTALNDHS